MSLKKFKPLRKPGFAPSNRLQSELRKVDALMEKQRYDEASELLTSLEKLFPNRSEILTAMVNLAYETKDDSLYEDAGRRLVRLEPDNADLHYGVAGAALHNGRLALALQRFRKTLARWPDHAMAASAREVVAELEEKLPSIIEEAGLPGGADAIEFATLNDETMAFMETGRYREARAVAESLLKREPHFAPALNNISMCYYLEGNFDQAEASVWRILDFAPDNVHALSNLCRYACLRGDFAEARQYADRLLASEAYGYEKHVKIVEALSYLGDDQGVLDVVAQADGIRENSENLDVPLFQHLAGVAAMRLGNLEEARKRWKRAIQLAPDFEWSKENLSDLHRPIELRHAPWPFALIQWIRPHTLTYVIEQLETASDKEDEQRGVKLMSNALNRHPEIEKLLPVLLERGDPVGREFAFRIASFVKTPALLEALRDFALGQRGPDQMRMEAANIVASAGLASPGNLRVWVKGVWTDIMILGYEIYEEPQQKYSDQVTDWMEEAMEALKAHNPNRSEELLMQALEVEPDAPEILNNLAATYMSQKRKQEADELLRQIYARHPDYLFGRVNRAHIAIREGDLDEAVELIKPVLMQKRLHITEYTALCGAEVDLLLAHKEYDGAKMWLELWEQADPDNPALKYYKARLQRENLTQALSRLMPGRRKRDKKT